MNSGRLLVSASLLARRLSNLSLAASSAAAARRKPSSSAAVTTVCAYRVYSAVAARYSSSHHHIQHSTTTSITRRQFSAGNGGKKGSRTPPYPTEGDEPDVIFDEDATTADFFGVAFDDGDDPGKLGPEADLPPLYKRDAATGRFTGDVEVELSEEQRRVIESDDHQRSKLLMQRLEAHWKKASDEITAGSRGGAKELNSLGQRIREHKLSLNVLGRSVGAQTATERAEDGSELGHDDDGFSMQRLTQQEFESFRLYMKKRYKVDVSEDEMPVLQQESNRSNKTATESADEAILATKWMSAQALRQVDEHLDDNPYADLMPPDMSPSRLVNRKKAKSIPVPLLHHNNIPLLQSFLTETAQIRSRIQTRLGARDQRRVSRLVKRARNLGLIPYQGQFRSEQHGWVHARDIDHKRPWEKELERRGLVIKNKMTNMEKKNYYNYTNTNTTTTQGGESATYGNDDENF